jgi:putative FmdB family regulatory protein
MPIYEYQCASCRKKSEFIQSFSDPHPVKCPSCGGALKKLLSSPTAHFKGSGFHATDYGKSGGKPEDSSKGREGDSSKGKEGDSSKGKEADGGAPSEAGAGSQGDSAGDSSKEKKESGDSSKEKSDSAPRAAKEAAHAKASNAPSKKNKPTKD